MSDIARRVIQITADQVIGPPRRRRPRHPKADPMQAANWTTPLVYLTPSWGDPDNQPTQQGFGHMDKIAQGIKRSEDP